MATPLLTCTAPRRTGGCGQTWFSPVNPHLEGVRLVLRLPRFPPCTLQSRSYLFSLLLISLCWLTPKTVFKRLFKVNAWGSLSPYHGVRQQFCGNFFSSSVHVTGSFRLYLTALHVHSPAARIPPFLASRPRLFEAPFPKYICPVFPYLVLLSSLSLPLALLCSSQVFSHPFFLPKLDTLSSFTQRPPKALSRRRGPWTPATLDALKMPLKSRDGPWHTCTAGCLLCLLAEVALISKKANVVFNSSWWTFSGRDFFSY